MQVRTRAAFVAAFAVLAGSALAWPESGGRASAARLVRGHQRGSVSIDPTTRALRVDWEAGKGMYWSPEELRLAMDGVLDLRDALSASVTRFQQVLLSHAASAACVLPSADPSLPDRLLVGGVDDERIAVVDLWTVTWPAVMPSPLPGARCVEILEPEFAFQRCVASLGACDRARVRSKTPVLRATSTR